MTAADVGAVALGRRRDRTIDERVLAAARALLIEEGWDATSVRAIASRAGVSRTAVQRRWPSKAHLVLDALLGAAPDLEPFAGTDREGWIRWVVEGSLQLFHRPEVRAAVPGLLASLRDHEDIRSVLWQGFSGPAAELFALRTGSTRRGDTVELDARAAIVLAAGAAMFLSLVAGDDDTPALHRRITELILRGLDRQH